MCDDVLRLIERLLRSVLNETRYLFIDEKRDEVGEIFTSLIVPLVRRFGDRLIPATLDLVGLIEDDLTRLTGLAALAFGLPDDVFGEALALLKRLEGHATESDDEGVLLSALAIIAAQLARHARDESNLLDLYDRALRMATDVPDSKRRALTLLRLGGLLEDLLRQDALPEAQVRELVQAAQRYARYQNDRPRLVLTLAILFPWLSHSTQEQARDSLLAAVNREYPKRRQNSLMGKAAQEERESILRRINSNPNPVMVSAETDNRTEMDALFSRWALQIRQIAESTRPALLAALPTMLTDIERLGGKTAVEEVYRAVEKAGRWWPQQVDAQNGDDQSEPDQTPQIGTRVFDDKEALIGYVDDLGVVYNTVGQTVGRIAQETVITPHGPYPYEVKVQVLNSQDEPVAYMANPRGDADSMHDVSGLYLGETFLEGTAFLPNDITVVVSANGQRLGYVEGDMPGHAIGAKVLLHHLLP